ncbi:hypothetical protein B7L32_03480 [Serratia marcescens]|nr:hypothetical protein B7L32_03480 [Serratia marcescens]
MISFILRYFGISRADNFRPEDRLKNILIANKNKFSIDCDGVLHVNWEHPEVIAGMQRQIIECSKIKVRK